MSDPIVLLRVLRIVDTADTRQFGLIQVGSLDPQSAAATKSLKSAEVGGGEVERTAAEIRLQAAIPNNLECATVTGMSDAPDATPCGSKTRTVQPASAS